MTADTVAVAIAVTLAALWLAWRAWRSAKAKYQSGPCCGDGCGCVKPVIFGKKNKRR